MIELVPYETKKFGNGDIWPSWFLKVNWDLFELVLITGLPKECNTLDIQQINIPMIHEDWFLLQYSYHPIVFPKDETKGLYWHLQNGNKVWLDIARNNCLMDAGYKYDQCTLLGFLDELPPYFDHLVSMLAIEPLIILKGRTAVIGIDLKEHHKQDFICNQVVK